MTLIIFDKFVLDPFNLNIWIDLFGQGYDVETLTNMLRSMLSFAYLNKRYKDLYFAHQTVFPMQMVQDLNAIWILGSIS